MRLTWLCVCALLAGTVSCSRTDENAGQGASKNAAAGGPEALNTPSQVARVANALARAAENKDVKGVMAVFAKDAHISVGPGSSSPREFTYDTYESYLADTFPAISAYTYQRAGETIQQQGEDIVFSFVLNETYEVQGQRLSQSHRETWHLRPSPTGLQIHKIRIDP